MNQKDIIAQNIKILNNKDVSQIINKDSTYIFSALTVEGGGVFKKGLAIGMQDKMINGLLLYDNENFYGYSDKNGLSLLSSHQEYCELDIPLSSFENKEERLQPVPKNTSEHFNTMSSTTKEIHKNLNIDLHIEDTNNFYITIPSIYNESAFILTFDITYIYDMNSIISNLTIAIINESDKDVFFKITNKCYYAKDFDNKIDKKSVTKIGLEIINENCFIIYKNSFV